MPDTDRSIEEEMRKRSERLLKAASKWVLDITNDSAIKRTKGDFPMYNTYVHYSQESNAINPKRRTICSTCPGILMGVISRKGKSHLNNWLKNNPNWLDDYSAPNKIRPNML